MGSTAFHRPPLPPPERDSELDPFLKVTAVPLHSAGALQVRRSHEGAAEIDFPWESVVA